MDAMIIYPVAVVTLLVSLRLLACGVAAGRQETEADVSTVPEP